MAQKLSYERYHWFHGQIKAGRYPNSVTLAEQAGISRKHAQREIEFMRDRLYAPLHYDPVRRGYEYEDSGYELPPVWCSEEELLALCIALRLSSAIPDRRLRNLLRDLTEKFLHFRSIKRPPDLGIIDDKVSIKNTQYYRVDEAIFRSIIAALFQGQAIAIDYRTPHTRAETERIVMPLHLLCYMGSWHLIAFCTLRGELRDFALSRIRRVEPGGGNVVLPAGLPSVKEHLKQAFGLMSGGETIEVCLKFASEVADWIAEQVWHRNQVLTTDDDGSICLTFPVADFREIKREILRYGASVEVLSPAELRDEVRKEIERMAQVYEKV